MGHRLFTGGIFEPAGFSPTVWFKANAETYNDGDNLTVVTNQGSVGASCNLNAFTGTPQWKANQFNGSPAYYFNGAEGANRANVGASTVMAAAAGTAIAVIRMDVASAGFPWLISESGVAARAMITSGVAQTVLSSNNDGATDVTATKTLTTGTNYIVTWHHETGSLYCGTNDTRTASMNTIASGNTNFAAGDDLFMGDSGGANFFNGYVAEVIFFNTAQTESQRQQWERWFAFKYAITIPY